MEYRDFCKPKIGCFRASIGCFSVFLKVQVKFNLHNTVIKQTAKKSRMKIEADQRRNCAAVIKEYGKKHLRGLLQGGAVPCKADFPVTVPSDSEMHKSERQNSAQIEIVLHGYFQKSRYNTNKNAVLHSPAENGGV